MICPSMRSSRLGVPIRFTLSLGLLYVASLCAYGQTISGSVNVTVEDSSGASIAGASVTLVSSATEEKTAGQTNSQGSFIFELVHPGTYHLIVSAPTFATANVTNLSVSIGEHINVPVKMAVGALTQTISASAESESLLNTESASVGQTIQSQTIQDLPLNGRDFIQLLLLGTGAAPVGSGDSPASGWTGRSNVTVSLGGLRETDTSYLVNGIESRNARFGNTGLFLSPDAIGEFRVQRTTFGAEFGLSASVVNMSIRNGTNAFHGDAFELNRNRDYAANDYFLNLAGEPRPPFNQNNFGATLAGPVIIPKVYNGRRRSFFMFNFEGFRQVQGEVLTGIFPSAAQLAGNLADDSAGTGIYPLNSDFCASNPGSLKCANVMNPFTGTPYPGNVITNLDPVDQKALPYIASPNKPSNAGAPTFPAFNTIGSPDIENNWNQYTGRIDQQLSEIDSLYATFTDETESLFQPALDPLAGNNFPLDDHLWTVTYAHTFNPHLINELRLGLNNSVTFLTPASAYGPNYAQSLFGLQNTNSNPLTFGIPDFAVGGFGGGGGIGDLAGSFPETIGAVQKNYQATDNIVLNRGKHNIMAGLELMHLRFAQNTDFSANPNFSFTGQFTGLGTAGIGLGDFLIGTPYTAAGAAGDSEQNLHTNYYGFYGQDNWQITRNLLLSYGLRYEYSLSPVESQNRQAYFDMATLQYVYAGQGARRSIIQPDYHEFAPRLGFSWKPSWLNNAVIRGGAGIYYATDNWNELQFSIVGTKYYQTQEVTSDPTTPTLSMENLLPPFSTTANSAPFTMDPNNVTPYYYQYGLDIQQELGGRYLFEVEYAGNIGKKLAQRFNPNQAVLDPTGTVPLADRLPYPSLSFILDYHTEGLSNYNALTAKIERRMTDGLSFLGAFTYSKALDEGITDDSSAISRDFRVYDYGVSDYDVPFRFVGNVLYELPFGHGKQFLGSAPGAVNYLLGGWQYNAIITLAAGQYETAGLPVDWLNIGPIASSRPNVDKSQDKVGRQAPTQYYNPAAFTYPSTHIEGNSGRNSFEQPGVANWDMSLFKAIPIHENVNFQFRFEFFNAFNHPQFGFANMGLGTGFGEITSDPQGPRVIQIGGRLNF
jgi:hypothetical protein